MHTVNFCKFKENREATEMVWYRSRLSLTLQHRDWLKLQLNKWQPPLSNRLYVSLYCSCNNEKI